MEWTSFKRALPLLLIFFSAEARAIEAVETDEFIIVNHPRRSYFLKLPPELKRAPAYRLTLLPGATETQVKEISTGNTKIAEKNVQILLAKANALYHQQQFDEALEHVLAAHELEPDNVRVNTMLGSLYYQLGASEMARRHWSRALELDPKQTEVKQFLEKFEKADSAGGEL